jgi:hypothetical protein
MKTNKTWKEFIKGKLAVQIETYEQYTAFIEKCDRYGLVWINGQPLKSCDIWSKREPDMCLMILSKKLCQGSRKDCMRWKYSVIKFNDLIKFI